jgi:hypothetical protein
VLLAAALALTACNGVGGERAPERVQRPDITTTTRVDHTGVVLGGVPGETTTTIRTSGRAAIVGVVRGPAGVAAGATVRIERLAPGGFSTAVVADSEGRYELRGIPGGRYRVRAFRPPDLAQVEPAVRFLAEPGEHRIDLEVGEFSGPVVRSSVAPDPPVLDQALNLVVQVGTRRVDGDGIVRVEPVPGLSVELSGLGAWQPAGATQPTTTTTAPRQGPPFTTTTTTTVAESSASSLRAVTDGAGRVRFALVCRRTGSPGLSVRFAVRRPAPPAPAPGPGPVEGQEQAPTTAPAPVTTTETVPLDLPACVDPTPPPTEPPAPSPGAGGGTDEGRNGEGGNGEGGNDDGEAVSGSP